LVAATPPFRRERALQQFDGAKAPVASRPSPDVQTDPRPPRVTICPTRPKSAGIRPFPPVESQR
jgi:hypothetical protein